MRAADSIYVRIVGVDGMRVTVSSTHPGDFREIGEPPIKIEGVEMEGHGREEACAKNGKSSKDHRLIFTAKHGQDLKRLQLNKRYKLSSY
jgi:hypothetical protein